MTMDMDILTYNIYINFYEGLYNIVYDLVNNQELELPKSKGLFKKNKITEKEFILNRALAELDEFYIDNKCDREYMLSFNSLWQFCQFVRYIEKVNMYKNDPDLSSFYVDSDMLELKERTFGIEYDDKTSFNFKLEKVEEDVNKQEFKVITLNIKRKYGKQMVNIFTIVNADVKLNDSSDLYLIRNVNECLYREMLSILKQSVIDLVDSLYKIKEF